MFDLIISIAFRRIVTPESVWYVYSLRTLHWSMCRFCGAKKSNIKLLRTFACILKKKILALWQILTSFSVVALSSIVVGSTLPLEWETGVLNTIPRVPLKLETGYRKDGRDYFFRDRDERTVSNEVAYIHDAVSLPNTIHVWLFGRFFGPDG